MRLSNNKEISEVISEIKLLTSIIKYKIDNIYINGRNINAKIKNSNGKTQEIKLFVGEDIKDTFLVYPALISSLGLNNAFKSFGPKVLSLLNEDIDKKVFLANLWRTFKSVTITEEMFVQVSLVMRYALIKASITDEEWNIIGLEVQ